MGVEVLISCCMMVRDEAEMLPACLQSIQGLVDEIVVVDTGSVDGTQALARAAGAQVLEQPWRDDFSAPRNLALSAARGKWVLVLDADERLSPGAHGAIREAIARDHIDCGLLELRNANRLSASIDEVMRGQAQLGVTQWVPRLFRRFDNLRWDRIIHEQPLEWFKRGPKCIEGVEGAAIVHYGAVPEIRAAQGKNQRNLKLLEKHCREFPQDSSAISYLSNTFRDMGDTQRAKAEAKRAWAAVSVQMADLSGGIMQPTNVVIAAMYANDLRDAGELEQAIEVLRVALRWNQAQIDQDHPNLTFQLGVCFEQKALTLAGDARAEQEALFGASEAYEMCLSKDGQPFAEPVVLDGCTGAAGYIRLGTVRLRQGDHAGASEAFEGALELDSKNAEALLGSAEAALGGGNAMECLRRVSAHLGDDAPDAATLAALGFRALGDNGRILGMVKRAVACMQAHPFVAPHRRRRLVGLCELMQSVRGGGA